MVTQHVAQVGAGSEHCRTSARAGLTRGGTGPPLQPLHCRKPLKTHLWRFPCRKKWLEQSRNHFLREGHVRPNAFYPSPIEHRLEVHERRLIQELVERAAPHVRAQSSRPLRPVADCFCETSGKKWKNRSQLVEIDSLKNRK